MSQVNQTYDQNVAKSDKLMIHKLLDAVRGYLHVLLCQYQLMSICLSELAVVPYESWILSFKTMNLHPDRRTSFLDRAKRIDDKILKEAIFFCQLQRSI